MSTHPHAPDLAALVARVERYCLERGLALTPMRRRVLEALAASGTPPSAYDLADRLSGTKRVAPVQIYRALDFLQEAGVVHRIATRSTYVTCGHEHAPGETVVFLVCAACGAVEEAHSRGVERGLAGAAQASRFKPRQHVVEVEGECAACQDAGAA